MPLESTRVQPDSQRHAEPVRVLVVDDEDEVLDILAAFLRKNGYAVSTAKNGVDALRAVDRDGGIAVVLLDVVMPEMGGFEILRDIVSRQSHPEVIMMTGLAEHRVLNALKFGAFDYVFKPFDFDGLKASILASLRHAQQRGH